ncbi:MAG: hypothetical protein KDD22_02975 [Bdellovibrionales bacterium]|nr:hypothetical protein [Bdellovibrionales bacterium]
MAEFMEYQEECLAAGSFPKAVGEGRLHVYFNCLVLKSFPLKLSKVSDIVPSSSIAKPPVSSPFALYKIIPVPGFFSYKPCQEWRSDFLATYAAKASLSGPPLSLRFSRTNPILILSDIPANSNALQTSFSILLKALEHFALSR